MIIRFLLLLSVASFASTQGWWVFEWNALYTRVVFKAEGDSLAAEKVRLQLDSLYTLQTKTLQWGSPLDSAIRKARPGNIVAVSPEFIGLFAYGEKRFQDTKGLFHPGIGDLLHAYGLIWGGHPHVPQGDTLAKLKAYLAEPLFYETIPQKNAIRIRSTGHRYALGAIAEGWALEKAAAIVEKAGFHNYYLESGGDIHVKGHNPKGLPWSIGIQDPDKEDGVLGAVHIEPGVPHCFSTSGVYEKFFIDSQGQRRSHILNPKTAASIQGMKSVTAFAKSSLECDFWDTYLLLLPFAEACALVEKTPDLEAIIVGPDSTYVSSGLRKAYKAN